MEGVWEAALRWDSIGAARAYTRCRGLRLPLQRWEPAEREQKCLGFRCEVLPMLPGAALLGLLLAAPQAWRSWRQAAAASNDSAFAKPG